MALVSPQLQLSPGLKAQLDSMEKSIAAGGYDPTQALAGLATVKDAAPAAGLATSDQGPTGTGPLSASDVNTGLSFQIQGKATPRAKAAVQLAEQYMGTPYVWGGEKPGGFDCSGLLQYVWNQKGVQIPRTTYDQFKAGASIPKSQLRPGDAVFFTGSDPQGGLPGHVGMYIGGGKFIEAPHTGDVVHISDLAGRSDYVGARRFG